MTKNHDYNRFSRIYPSGPDALRTPVSESGLNQVKVGSKLGRLGVRRGSGPEGSVAPPESLEHTD